MTAYRFLGTTDECVECQRCGRTELRSTVVLAVLDADGNVEDTTYYGSSCAARVLGRTEPGAAGKVLAEARAAQRRTVNAARDARRRAIQNARYAEKNLMHYGLPTDGVITTEMLTAAARRYGRENPRASAPDAALEAVMDMVARHRVAVANAAALSSPSMP